MENVLYLVWQRHILFSKSGTRQNHMLFWRSTLLVRKLVFCCYKLLDTEEMTTYLMGAIQFNKKTQL